MKILAYSSRWGFSIPIALRKFKEVVPALIILCSTFFITPLTAQVSLNATASADPVNIGDSFTLDIDIASGTQTLNSVGVSLSYDPAIFQLSNPVAGSTLPTVINPADLSTPGSVTFGAGLISPPGATESGSFNIISFDVTVVGGSGQESIDFIVGSG
ncbi:MAG: cohesin domain-containing protein, partial [Bacteroidota bacterium]